MDTDDTPHTHDPALQTDDGYVVRPATGDDLPGVAAVYAHYVAESTATFEEVAPGIEFWRERHASTLAQGWPFLVAVDADDVVVGYAYVGWWRPRPAYRFTVETSIYVAADVAGHGLGRRLLEPVLDSAAAAGAREAVAVISSGASPASRRLHESLGFEAVGVLTGVGVKRGEVLDTAILQKHLRAP
ncbi:phosphinothricin acetyltransferase [Sediminihabitans luteus]|uniref:Phosphinothricin acetyltransferase n=1 Tax=Sediminihabitans luteus TaxID=1138585 RepID=A0A2M9CEZ8_9CELL|nr:GNAT family N-acetyltransferase [Sediminihabitans luteus]PJJ70430.1 phosphinothricin acetyltransferase [Sediminihabitans luteus]GII97903.1 N-acetyltransferase [Sediminihabitans luteus]